MSAAPAARAGVKGSPSTADASARATTSSAVANTDVRTGPTRSSPSKKHGIARAPQTRAIPSTAHQPEAVAGKCGPRTKAAPVKIAAATVVTTTEEAMGVISLGIRVPATM
jgi:hypothetical protein